MTCSTCGQDRIITLAFEQRLWNRVITWRLCVPCHLKEQRAAA